MHFWCGDVLRLRQLLGAMIVFQTQELPAELDKTIAVSRLEEGEVKVKCNGHA